MATNKAAIIERASAIYRKHIHSAHIVHWMRAKRIYSACMAEAKRQDELHEKRECSRAGMDHTVGSDMTHAIETRLSKRLKQIYPLRKGSSAWAGGKNYYWVSLIGDAITPDMEVTTEREWSSNGKWAGNNYYYTLTVPASYTFDLIGGILTIYPRARVYNQITQAYIVKQGRGMDAYIVPCYLWRDYHCRAKTIEKAGKEVEKVRKLRIKNAIAKRLYLKNLSNVWVTFQDSVQSGNCKIGTEAWAKRYMEHIHADGEIGAVRADALLKYEDTIYTQRAVARAIASMAHR